MPDEWGQCYFDLVLAEAKSLSHDKQLTGWMTCSFGNFVIAQQDNKSAHLKKEIL